MRSPRHECTRRTSKGSASTPLPTHEPETSGLGKGSHASDTPDQLRGGRRDGVHAHHARASRARCRRRRRGRDPSTAERPPRSWATRSRSRSGSAPTRAHRFWTIRIWDNQTRILSTTRQTNARGDIRVRAATRNHGVATCSGSEPRTAPAPRSAASAICASDALTAGQATARIGGAGGASMAFLG